MKACTLPLRFISRSHLLIVFLLFSEILYAGTGFAEKGDLPFGIRHYDIGIAENFQLKDIDGEVFELKQARGHWVFLHFWASWCGPCREEMPAIQKLADSLQADGLQIVMINTAEDEDTIFEFLANIDIDLNSLLDSDGMVTERWKPRGLPTTFLISPEGRVRYQAIGGREWDKKIYYDFIKALLSQTAHSSE